MSDILLNTDGDINISNGLISLISSEAQATAQRLTIKLKTYQGEWYLDISEGIPYFQQLFSRSGDIKNIADNIFKQEIILDEGITSLTKFSSTLSSSGNYVAQFEAVTVDGEIVTVEQNFNF